MNAYTEELKMTSYLKQLSEKSRQNADNAKEPQGGREEDVGEYNSPFLASADVPPVILDESFGKDMRKDEMVLIIQNLMKENFLLRGRCQCFLNVCVCVCVLCM